MATIEQPQATETIDVENPATGRVIRSVPATSADELQAMVERARAAQVGWEALGFEGRGRVLRRMQKWLVDNHDRVVRTIVDETGKTWEDAAVAEVLYGDRGARLLGRARAEVPGRRADPRRRPLPASAAGWSSATARSAWSASSDRGTTR